MTPVVWFVTGTDTGVGKTVASAAVAAVLAGSGRDPYVVKPAQTGVTSEPGDLDEVRRLAGPVAGHEGVRLAAPLAPDSAARLEGVVLPGPEEQSAPIIAAGHRGDVVVEGAGGVLVPLGPGWTLLDLADRVAAADLEVRFLVVARAGLGTLNHTALTVGAIENAGHHAAGVIIGSWPDHPGLAETTNLEDLPRLTGVPLLGRIPSGAGSWEPAAFQASAAAWLNLDAP